MYRLSTYRIARNGNVGGSSVSLKAWVQDRSTIVTAKFVSEGLIWEPSPCSSDLLPNHIESLKDMT